MGERGVAERARKACADVERWASEVKQLTAGIRQALEACENAQFAAREAARPDTDFGQWEPVRHIDEAIEAEHDAGVRQYHDDVPVNPSDVASRLENICAHCHLAWELGRRRKKAKKELAAARLRVRWAGKAALREPAHA